MIAHAGQPSASACIQCAPSASIVASRLSLRKDRLSWKSKRRSAHSISSRSQLARRRPNNSPGAERDASNR
ncbi:hypothetical protein FQZ97_1134520 [compost metagenome]